MIVVVAVGMGVKVFVAAVITYVILVVINMLGHIFCTAHVTIVIIVGVNIAVRCYVLLGAAVTLMPVVGAVALPLIAETVASSAYGLSVSSTTSSYCTRIGLNTLKFTLGIGSNYPVIPCMLCCITIFAAAIDTLVRMRCIFSVTIARNFANVGVRQLIDQKAAVAVLAIGVINICIFCKIQLANSTILMRVVTGSKAGSVLGCNFLECMTSGRDLNAYFLLCCSPIFRKLCSIITLTSRRAGRRCYHCAGNRCRSGLGASTLSTITRHCTSGPICRPLTVLHLPRVAGGIYISIHITVTADGTGMCCITRLSAGGVGHDGIIAVICSIAIVAAAVFTSIGMGAVAVVLDYAGVIVIHHVVCLGIAVTADGTGMCCITRLSTGRRDDFFCVTVADAVIRCFIAFPAVCDSVILICVDTSTVTSIQCFSIAMSEDNRGHRNRNHSSLVISLTKLYTSTSTYGFQKLNYTGLASTDNTCMARSCIDRTINNQCAVDIQLSISHIVLGTYSGSSSLSGHISNGNQLSGGSRTVCIPLFCIHQVNILARGQFKCCTFVNINDTSRLQHNILIGCRFTGLKIDSNILVQRQNEFFCIIICSTKSYSDRIEREISFYINNQSIRSSIIILCGFCTFCHGEHCIGSHKIQKCFLDRASKHSGMAHQKCAVFDGFFHFHILNIILAEGEMPIDCYTSRGGTSAIVGNLHFFIDYRTRFCNHLRISRAGNVAPSIKICTRVQHNLGVAIHFYVTIILIWCSAMIYATV